MNCKSRLYFLALTCLLLTFSACDSNDPEEPEDIVGSFEIQVTGAITQTITGIQAGFGSATDARTGITGFGMTLTSGGAAAQGLTFSRKGARPGNGSHNIINFGLDTEIDTINDDDLIGVFSAGTDVFYSTGGTLSITSSSATRLEGTLTMTARSILPQSTAEVSITGSFTAVGADIGSVGPQ